MRKWTQLALIIAVLGYGVTILISALGVQRVDFLTRPTSGDLSFDGTLVDGLPASPEAGRRYVVRVLLPQATDGSRLDFSALDTQGNQLEPLVLLCPPEATEPDDSVCLTELWDTGVVFGSEDPVELPAVVVFPESFAGATVRLQYSVTDPDAAWNPLDSPRTRLFVLGHFAVSSAP